MKSKIQATENKRKDKKGRKTVKREIETKRNKG